MSAHDPTSTPNPSEKPAPTHVHAKNSVPPTWAKWILRGLFSGCALLIAIELIFPPHGKHPLEKLPLLYPFWGFVGIALLIVLAKGLRRLVMRSEDYYDAR